MNRDFSACPSYPEAVIVPAAVSDDTVIKAARFRQGGRFPVLSYFHPRNGTVSLSRPSAGGGRGLRASRAAGGGFYGLEGILGIPSSWNSHNWVGRDFRDSTFLEC